MKTILTFLFLVLVGCGKSSDQKTFPIPKNIPNPKVDSPPTPTDPITPSTSTQVTYSFPNYNDDANSLSSKAYYVNQDTTVTLPLVITTYNSLNTSIFYVILGETYCQYNRNSFNEYIAHNCLSQVNLKKQDAVFVYGIPFSSIVSITITFN